MCITFYKLLLLPKNRRLASDQKKRKSSDNLIISLIIYIYSDENVYFITIMNIHDFNNYNYKILSARLSDKKICIELSLNI